MDEEKKKEWLANRIDMILVAISGQFKGQEEEFIMESKKITDAQREIQKTILVLLGIGIAIMIGINSQTDIPETVFVKIIIGFAVLMLFTFIASLFYDYYLSRFFNQIRNAYKFQFGDISRIRGDFLEVSTQIEDYNSEQFQTYVKFCWIMSASAQIITLKAYENLYNSRQGYKSLKKHSESRISQIKYTLEKGISVYDQRIKEFKKEELLNPVINRLKPIEDYKNQKKSL
ncbi:MAG: hypothetical protein IIA83_08925 [Thaumarchaeota archaeon]|nr:hypothetical protein [Nitrososphaerota archaeon]